MSLSGDVGSFPAKASRAGFFSPALVPFEESAWRKLDFRGRLRLWLKLQEKGSPAPHVGAASYAVKLNVWIAVFNYIFRDRKRPWTADLNVKRWIVYNILHDVLGCGATSGPLGFKFNLKRPCQSWWYFLQPGTLTLPLAPRCGSIRTWPVVAVFVGYIAALLRALRAPQIGFREVAPALAALAVLAPFDVLPFFASRGEHYVYQMVCLAFPGQQWRFGCQLVQVALWTWAGISKIGPWFKYSIAFMVPNCVFLQGCLPVVRRLLFHDPPHDLRTSALNTALAHLGTVGELSMGGLCLFGPTRRFGFLLALGFHSFIISMTPIASVFEWNIYSMLMTWFLFGKHVARPAGFTVRISPALMSFLLTVLVLVPAYGQLFPARVPFLMAYRPYAGNWRWMWVVVTKTAVAKLRRLRTFESPVLDRSSLGILGDEPRYEEHFEYMANAASMLFPNYRALPSIVEKLMSLNGYSVDDVHILPHVQFENKVLGWSLGIGWGIFREPFRAEVQRQCNFELGECFFAKFEPLGLTDRQITWQVIDVSNGESVLRGEHGFAEAEDLKDPIGFVAVTSRD